MASSNNRHVVPNPKGGWDVKAPGAERASSHAPTRTSAQTRPLPQGAPAPTPFLTGAERNLLERITDPAWEGPRRIEQERIPLDAARRELIRHFRDQSR